MDNTGTDNTQLAETGGQHTLMEHLKFNILQIYIDGLNGTETFLDKQAVFFKEEINQEKPHIAYYSENTF